MSSSKKKMERKAMAGSRQPEKKSKVGLISGIAAAVVVVLIFGMLILFKGPYFMKHSTAMTVGTHEVSPVTARYFYADTFNTFASSYGSYFAYMFEDTSSIDTQVYDSSTGETYGDYFMEQAKEQMQATYSVYDQAEAAGYVLSQEYEDSLDSTEAMLKSYAESYGYTTDGYLAALYGKGSTMKSYMEYERIVAIATAYAEETEASFTYDASELAEAYDADPVSYDSFTYYSYLVGAAVDTDATEEETAEAMDAAKEKAESIVEAATDETAYLEKIAEVSGNDDYLDPSNTVHIDVQASTISAISKDWLTDDSRVSGDCTMLEYEDTGYYVLYFVDRDDNDYTTVNANVIEIDADTDDDGNVTWDAAEEQIAALQADVAAADTVDADLFTTLAATYSDDSDTADTAGLYEQVHKGTFSDAEVEDWLLDSSRKVGDTVEIRTENAYYYILISGVNGTYRDYLVESELREEDYEAWYNGIVDAAPEVVENEFGMKHMYLTLSYNAG